MSVLSFSLCFSSVTVSYYQAAALAPAVWTLIEVLFLSLGITLHVADTADRTTVNEDLAEEARELAEMIENGEQKGSLLELADFFENISSHWMPVAGLIVPLIVWDGLKLFCGMQQEVAKPVYRPAFADINLYGCTYGQYVEYLAGVWNVPVSDSFIIKFALATYDDFIENDYSCLLLDRGSQSYSAVDGTMRYIGNYGYISLDGVNTLRFREYSASNQNSMLLVNQNNAAISSCMGHLMYYLDDMTLLNEVSDSYTISFGQVRLLPSDLDNTDPCYKRDFYIVSHGRFYDMFDVLQFPQNNSTALEYGNEVNVWTDFLVPQMDICTGVTADCVIDIPLDDYDVQAPGREWDEEKDKLVGDVPLNIPSQNALDDYYNGLITWDELMEQIGAKPVDTSKPLEGDIPKEDASGGIIDSIGNVIDTIIDTTANIIDAILGIPATLLDGVLWLFVPSDGFVEGKLEEMMNRASSLGVVPFDLYYIFHSDDDNPFKDIVVEIYGQEVVIVSFKYLPMFLDRFRPAIRGLLALFMLYYSVNQFLELFGLAGVLKGGDTGRIEETRVSFPR